MPRFAVPFLAVLALSSVAAAQESAPSVASTLQRALAGIGTASPYSRDHGEHDEAVVTDEPTRFGRHRLCEGAECLSDAPRVRALETAGDDGAIELAATRERAGAQLPPDATSSASEARGAWSADIVDRYVHREQARITACFQQAIGRGADVGGLLEARFVIGRDGRVRGMRLPRRVDRAFATCMREVLSRIELPRAERETRVAYPFFAFPIATGDAPSEPRRP